MGHQVYRFIEPSRPEPMALRETLIASLAATVTAPGDNLELASAVGDQETVISDAIGALIDAETPRDEALAIEAIRRGALTTLALLAAYEARS